MVSLVEMAYTFSKSSQSAAVKSTRRMAERSELVRRGLRSGVVGTGQSGATWNSPPTAFTRGVMRAQAREDYLKGQQGRRGTLRKVSRQVVDNDLAEAAGQRQRPFGMNSKQAYANTREHVRRARQARQTITPLP